MSRIVEEGNDARITADLVVQQLWFFSMFKQRCCTSSPYDSYTLQMLIWTFSPTRLETREPLLIFPTSIHPAQAKQTTLLYTSILHHLYEYRALWRQTYNRNLFSTHLSLPHLHQPQGLTPSHRVCIKYTLHNSLGGLQRMSTSVDRSTKHASTLLLNFD